MGRFEITRVQVDIAGPQEYTLDGHISTRAGKSFEVISVTLGQIVVYVYDLAAARAFATGWRSALRFIPVGLPHEISELDRQVAARSEVGMLLHIAGVPEKRRIHGIAAGASPTGSPHVRVELGRLIVHAHDLASITTAAAAWDAVERTAARMWPEVDAFAEAETRSRARDARVGRTTKAETASPMA